MESFFLIRDFCLTKVKEKSIITFMFCLIITVTCNAKIVSVSNLINDNTVWYNSNTNILSKEKFKLSDAKSLKFKDDGDYVRTNVDLENDTTKLLSNNVLNQNKLVTSSIKVTSVNLLDEDIQLLEVGDQQPSNKYIFKLKYKAKKEREIHIEIRDPENVWLGFNKVIVKKGSRKINLNVELVNKALIGDGYKVTAILVPVGKDWKEKIKNSERRFNVIAPGALASASVEEDLQIMDMPDQQPTDNYTFELKYIAKTTRDIIIEIRDQRKKWLGSNRVTIFKGSGTTNITVKIPNIAKIASGYKVLSLLVPVGKDWQDKIKDSSRKFNVTNDTKAGIEGISTYIPPKEEHIQLLKIPNQKPSNSFTFSIEYDVNQEREIQVEVRDPKHKWLDLINVKVNKGSGRASVTMNVPKKVGVGNDYTATAILVPTGKDWRDAIKTSTKKFNVVRR